MSDIIGTSSGELEGKKLILCITGSIAAVETVKIARELIRRGAEVHVVMSKAAQKIVHPNALEWATGRPVITEITGKTEYVELLGGPKGKADLLLIAPATINTISKIAHGICDTPVIVFALAALGSRIPVLVCPAMHETLYDHQIMRDNIDRLKTLGFEFVEPRLEEGKAKLASTDTIVERVLRRLGHHDMAGLKVLITAGPTHEHIDPIRIITNRSSGKMGAAIAQEALRRGAEVTLVYGPGAATPPAGAKVLWVEATEEMREAVVSELKSASYDFVVAVAAAADYTPAAPYNYKLPSSEVSDLTLRLKATPKIIDEVKKICPDVILILFRAVYNLPEENMIRDAYDRLIRSNADIIVVNDVSKKGVEFGSDTSEVIVVDNSGNFEKIPLSLKSEIAKKILNRALNLKKSREGR
ncbi:MAG: bifunctional phosphopantothenoylcysteine decarboxylase/phosphopantothenate--cysteine ligase CoaBC [Candidatus Bathyarchaeia archaeon]